MRRGLEVWVEVGGCSSTYFYHSLFAAKMIFIGQSLQCEIRQLFTLKRTSMNIVSFRYSRNDKLLLLPI